MRRGSRLVLDRRPRPRVYENDLGSAPRQTRAATLSRRLTFDEVRHTLTHIQFEPRRLGVHK